MSDPKVQVAKAKLRNLVAEAICEAKNLQTYGASTAAEDSALKVLKQVAAILATLVVYES